MIGGVGWYRKDFSLPDASRALEWAVRFESVNYRSRVWLNGKRVGSNRGAYIPFEFRLDGLKRRGTNRLVIRVDSKRRSTDFPPSGLATNGAPTGGWWNYSGLQREVYLKRLDTVDWKSVRVIPRLACASCTASVQVKVITAQRPRRAARTCGSPATSARAGSSLGSKRDPRQRRAASFTTTFRMPQPARVVARAARTSTTSTCGRARAGARSAATGCKTGIRSIRVSGDGHLILNGRAREPARRRRARGLQGPGLRGRQRVPPAARLGDQGGGRDADAHPLPDAPLHARARRPGRAC